MHETLKWQSVKFRTDSIGNQPSCQDHFKEPNIGQYISLSVLLLCNKNSHSCLISHCISTIIWEKSWLSFIKQHCSPYFCIAVFWLYRWILCCCLASLLCFLTEIVKLERSFQKLKSLWKWNKHPFSSSASAFWDSTCSDPWQSSTKEGPRCCLDWPEPWSAYGGWKSHHSLCCLPSVSRGTQDARYDKEGNTEVWWLGWRRWSAVPRGRWSCWYGRCDGPRWGKQTKMTAEGRRIPKMRLIML